jgi:hypothetical protein
METIVEYHSHSDDSDVELENVYYNEQNLTKDFNNMNITYTGHDHFDNELDEHDLHGQEIDIKAAEHACR